MNFSTLPGVIQFNSIFIMHKYIFIMYLWYCCIGDGENGGDMSVVSDVLVYLYIIVMSIFLLLLFVASDVDARTYVKRYNHTHVKLHPKTCLLILKSIRTLLPETVRDIGAVLETCAQRTRASILLACPTNDGSTKCISKSVDTCLEIYNSILRSGMLGLTIYELRVRDKCT